jgi:entericidin B
MESFKGTIMTRKIIIGLTAAIFALSATACNTVRGAGQDLESVANDVDQAI